MTDKEKQFNDILDECLDRLMFKGDTPEQCLADYPEFSEELGPLLETALITSGVNALEPSREFRRKARVELHSILQSTEENKRFSVFGFSWQRRLAAVMAGVCVVFAAAGGTAAAARNVMPDSFLYPVKIAAENVQIAFTFTDLGKAEAYALMADKRVDEIIYMANQVSVDANGIETLATNLNTNLQNIAFYSSKQGNAAPADDMGAGMKSFNAESYDAATGSADYAETEASEEISSLMAAPEVETAPGTEEPGAGIAAINDESPVFQEEAAESAVVNAPAPQAVTVTAAPGTADDGITVRWQALNSTLIDQSVSNLNSLYELLNIVPDSIRPVIERAIALSEAGYNIAINSLY